MVGGWAVGADIGIGIGIGTTGIADIGAEGAAGVTPVVVPVAALRVGALALTGTAAGGVVGSVMIRK
jgi:hypothetical protein